MKQFLFVLLSLLSITRVDAQTVSADRFYLNTGPCVERSGSGSPNGSVVGSVCDTYHDTSTGEVYRKTSGTATNTGWVGPSTLSKTDDTNVTLTLGGSATTALLNPASLTLGWTGTLAAARLNANVVQAITNDTNVTGSIATQNLTLGWTGQLAVPRGGTGLATVTTNGVPFGNGTGALGVTSAGGVNSVLAANSGNPFFTATPTLTTITTTSDATLGGNTGTSTFVSQTTGWRINSNGEADFRYLFVDEMRAKLFTADLEGVLAGSQRITKSFSTISQTFTCPAANGTSTLWVKDSATFGDAAVFVSGDTVLIHLMTRTVFGPFTIADCVGTVTAYADGTGANAGQQSWTFTRRGALGAGTMVATTTVPVNELVQDMGTTGNGYVETSAVDGAAGVNAPYMQIVTWTSSPVSANLVTRCRLGNLNGITAVAEYGLLCGSFSGNAYVRLSDQNAEIRGIPLKLYDGATETMRLDASVPSFALGATLPSAYGTGTGVWMGKDSGVYKFRVGVPAGAGIFWDGSTLNVSGTITVTGGNAAKTDFTNVTANYAASASVGGAATSAKGGVAWGATPSGSGLYLGSDRLGYYDGGAWKTFMDSSGNFYLGGTSGSLQWNGSTLTINGNGTFSGALSAATGTFNGSVSVAGGAVTINSSGIQITTPTGYTDANSYKFTPDTMGGTQYGLFAKQTSSINRYLGLLNNTTGTNAWTEITVTGNGATAASIALLSSSATGAGTITMFGTSVTIVPDTAFSATTSFSGVATFNNATTYLNGSYPAVYGDPTNYIQYLVYQANAGTPYIQMSTPAGAKGIYFNVSDEQTKKNIRASEDDAIAALRKVQFISYENVGANGTRHKVGVSAQQLATVDPIFVDQIPLDGTLLVNSNALLAYTMSALQESIKRQDAMEIRLAALEKIK